MVICNRCGHENPLGKVFCVKCGTKLDLAHMTSERVEEAKKHWSDPIVKHWRKGVAVIVILIIASIALALWWNAAPIGKNGTRVDGRKVDVGLAATRNLKANETRKFEFLEQDINGYFEFFKAKTLGVDSVRVSVHQGYFVVRIVKPFLTIPLPKYRVEMKTSYDITCVPVGRIAVPKDVKIGHLPVIGPIKNSVLQKVVKMFRKENEWASLRNIAELKSETGKIALQAKKQQ